MPGARGRRVERIDPSPLERLRAAILLASVMVALGTLLTLLVIGGIAASVATLSRLLG